MSSENFKRYIINSITLLKEQARNAKKNSDKGNDVYNQGIVMAYCSVISLLKYQAHTFNIDEHEIGLSDIDPEADLLGLHTIQDVEPEAHDKP